MGQNKILTLLGFASKAVKLQFGMDASQNSLKKKQAKLIITAADVSEKSKKEILFYATGKNVPVITLPDCDMETLSKAVGKKAGIIAVNDEGFANAMVEAFKQGGSANDK